MSNAKLSRRRVASHVGHMLRGLVRFMAWAAIRPRPALPRATLLETIVDTVRNEFPGLGFDVQFEHLRDAATVSIHYITEGAFRRVQDRHQSRVVRVEPQHLAISVAIDRYLLLEDPGYAIEIVRHNARELSCAIGDALAKGAA